MTKFDLIVLGVAAISAIVGFVRGFTKEILSLISWLSAISMAYFCFPHAQHLMRQQVANPLLADAITVFALFIVILIIMTIITNLLNSWIQNSSLGGINRSLGFLYGVARAVILLFITGLAINCFWAPSDHPAIFQNARFTPFMNKGSVWLYNWLPTSLQSMITKMQIKQLSPSNLSTPQDVAAALLTNGRSAQASSTALDADITADELSELKPKIMQMTPKKISTQTQHKQEASLDRLLDQTATSANPDGQEDENDEQETQEDTTKITTASHGVEVTPVTNPLKQT